ncbi:MAG: hypothetical protein CMP81_10750 [Fulvimarina sp.]|nr:hypothetical protein [Fulvimarina sp.]
MMIYPDPDGALRLTRNIYEKLAESLEDIAKAVSKAGVLSHKALTVAQSIRQLRPISPDYFAATSRFSKRWRKMTSRLRCSFWKSSPGRWSATSPAIHPSPAG